jgi:Ca-activated chloride channel family protein
MHTPSPLFYAILLTLLGLFLLSCEQSPSSSSPKTGRTFSQRSGANSYDQSAQSAKHRTGKIEGDGGLPYSPAFSNKIVTIETTKEPASQEKEFSGAFKQNKNPSKREQGLEPENEEVHLKKPSSDWAEEQKINVQNALGKKVLPVSKDLKNDVLSQTPPPTTKALDKNAYYGSNYIAGGGHLARLRTAIDSGIQVGNQQIRLESFIKQYRQNLAPPEQGALQLHVSSSHGQALETGGTLLLQVALVSSTNTLSERLPLNICLVLDRSGSMREEQKMVYAKEAAHHLVSLLKPSDYFSLVTYDTRALVEIPATPVQNKDLLQKQIARLSPGGSTNIYAGLELGYREIHKHFSPEFFNLVLLLSDGKPTAGPSDPYVIAGLAKKAFQDGIQTSSMGVGLDFNDQTMLEICTQGHGKYHFIENAEWIASALEEEFKDLNSMISMAIKTRIVLADHVDLLRVLGMYQLSQQEVRQVKQSETSLDTRLQKEFGIQKDRDNEEESGIKFFKSQMLSGETQLYLLEVRIPPGTGSLPLAQVEVKHKDLLQRSNEKLYQNLKLPYTSEESEYLASLSREVKRNQLGFETGYVLKESADLISRGHTAQACNKIKAHTDLLLEVGKAYQDGDLLSDGELLQKYYLTLKPFENQNIQEQALGKYFVKTFNFEGFRKTQ